MAAVKKPVDPEKFQRWIKRMRNHVWIYSRLKKVGFLGSRSRRYCWLCGLVQWRVKGRWLSL